MIVLPAKLLFLVAAFGIWRHTGNAKVAAGAWALSTFLTKLFVIGVTSSIAYYGIATFLVAWGVFFGLSFLYQSMWMIPASALGAIVMLILS